MSCKKVYGMFFVVGCIYTVLLDISASQIEDEGMISRENREIPVEARLGDEMKSSSYYLLIKGEDKKSVEVPIYFGKYDDAPKPEKQSLLSQAGNQAITIVFATAMIMLLSEIVQLAKRRHNKANEALEHQRRMKQRRATAESLAAAAQELDAFEFRQNSENTMSYDDAVSQLIALSMDLDSYRIDLEKDESAALVAIAEGLTARTQRLIEKLGGYEGDSDDENDGIWDFDDEEVRDETIIPIKEREDKRSCDEDGECDVKNINGKIGDSVGEKSNIKNGNGRKNKDKQRTQVHKVSFNSKRKYGKRRIKGGYIKASSKEVSEKFPGKSLSRFAEARLETDAKLKFDTLNDLLESNPNMHPKELIKLMNRINGH